MSEIATLAKLETFLSQPSQGSAGVVRVTRSKGSLMEAYFSEIQYSSFANSAAQHTLYTDIKPVKQNGAAPEYRLDIR